MTGNVGLEAVDLATIGADILLDHGLRCLKLDKGMCNCHVLNVGCCAGKNLPHMAQQISKFYERITYDWRWKAWFCMPRHARSRCIVVIWPEQS